MSSIGKLPRDTYKGLEYYFEDLSGKIQTLYPSSLIKNYSLKFELILFS